ncbi:hypothetical protein B0T40_24610 [Chromobacterium haemolyticum]|nr:hypothetical protein B0T40_24610 [Chromobacterium haemolyticum]
MAQRRGAGVDQEHAIGPQPGRQAHQGPLAQRWPVAIARGIDARINRGGAQRLTPRLAGAGQQQRHRVHPRRRACNAGFRAKEGAARVQAR